jgi:predicted regulator of Ras-like GTPase activity (Roadblock/LC7/MglB family)
MTHADSHTVTAEITRSMHQVLDHLVEFVPGVLGALVSSADGFALASKLPPDTEIDTAGLGAMSAAALALSNQLVKTAGDSAATLSHHRSAEGQVLMLPVAHLAVLTIMATPGADTEQLCVVGREATVGLQRLFRGAATV